MKYLSFRNSLAFSILLHMIVSLVISYHEHKVQPQTALPLELEILAKQPEENISAPKGKANGSSPSAQKSSGVSKKILQDLMSSTTVKLGRGLSEGGNSRGSSDPTGEPWGSRSVSMDSLENMLFYRTIYEAIDGSVYYPAVLAKRKIEGTFQARLTFDAVEGCLWKKATISEGNPYLRLFVLDLLRRACDDETIRRLRPLRTLTADLSFLFAIGEGPAKLNFQEDRRKHGPRMIGNVLMFEAHSVQSVMAWNLGPFTGVFPIPYVSVNFEWLQENWDKVVSGKTKTLNIR